MEYQVIDISTWTQMGEGGNGKTYVRHDNDSVLLKVNNPPRCDEATVKQELEVAKHVISLGVPTPRVFNMVRVGDGYGQLVENIKGKKSLARICADAPSCIAEAASTLATLGRQLHTTPCDTDYFPSRKELALKGIEIIELVPEEDKAKMRQFAESLKDETTCTHGDFHMGNLIISGDGNPYWIDLGWFGHGSAMFDFGHLFLICHVYSKFPQACDIFHMEVEQLKTFWDACVKSYTGNSDHAAFDALAGKFAPLDICIRNVLVPSSSEEYKKMFGGVIHSLVEKFY
jgi:uncharacterized protein (TIGR02172 family)